MSAATKKSLINASCDSESLFGLPDRATYYTDDELRLLATSFKSEISFEGLGPVQRSHVVKGAFIQHLGYPKPTRFRGKDREHKPKFRAQLMDIFVQSSTNLQVWNYLPYNPERVPNLPDPWERMTYADCRYVIIPVIGDKLGKCRVVKGSELGILDKTKARTIKYQATAPPRAFSARGLDVVGEVEGVNRRFCAGKWSANEVAALLLPLVGTSLPAGSDRQIGQEFHKAVARSFGGTDNAVDNGQFPDLPPFQTEAKFQMSPTIDLGMTLPPSTDVLENGIVPANVTYVLGFAALSTTPKIESITVILGRDFEERFKIWNSLNSKVQIPIPASWLA